MHTAIAGSAKAVTPFGPLAGRTPVYVTDQGTDSAVIEFSCGATPVILAVAGPNYLALVRALIANASAANREALTAALRDVAA